MIIMKDDVISRQMALRTDCFGDGHDGLRAFHVYEDYLKMRKYLESLPPAQQEPQWIPCSDPSDLPKDERLWITREISDGFFTLREVSDVIWDMTEWSDSVSNVVAYMPYWEPEPYTERREE